MDDVLPRIAVLLLALLVAAAAGALVHRRAGRARRVAAGVVLAPSDLDAELGSTATYLQLSSPACSPCRSVSAMLTALVAGDPGLQHVEVDASQRLELARRLQVLRTPTVLVLDPAGRVVSRFSGPATAEQARAALPATAGVRS